MVYYILFIIILLMSIYEIIAENYSYKFYKYIYAVIILFLIIFAGTRYLVGYDYGSYKNIHDLINAGLVTFKTSDIDISFFVFNKIFKSFYYIIFFCALMSISIKAVIIGKQQKYIFVSLLVYFSTIFISYDMGVIRQGLASAITLYSIMYILKNEPKKFVIAILIASSFHITALFFLPSYYLSKKVYSRRKIYIVIGICFLLAFTNFSQLIFRIAEFIPISMVSNKIKFYNQSVIYNVKVININMLKRLIMLFVFTELIKRNYSENKYYNILLNNYFIGTCIFYFFKSFRLLSDRGSMYYNCIEILLLPLLLYITTNKYFKIIILVFIGVYCYYNLNNTFNISKISDQPYIPYRSTLFSK